MNIETAEKILDASLLVGGGTFHFDGAPLDRKEGYVVAVANAKGAHQVPLDNPDTAAEAIVDIARRYNYEGCLIGLWVDSGTIYIDPVIVLTTERTAQLVGRYFEQQAIYDLAEGKAIDVV